MKLWHISDTHGTHEQLSVPEGVDIVIHSGDESNSRNPNDNSPEFYDFIWWFGNVLNIKHKIFIAGNHSSWIERNEEEAREICQRLGIHFLKNESVEIEGLKIWGSPFSHTFNDWCYMKNRMEIGYTWDTIPKDTDILVTHGMPKGILDLAENERYELEQVGDDALLTRIGELKNLKLHLGGHIHDSNRFKNQGILIRDRIVYSNASCVTLGNKISPTSNGNLFHIDKNKKVSIIH